MTALARSWSLCVILSDHRIIVPHLNDKWFFFHKLYHPKLLCFINMVQWCCEILILAHFANDGTCQILKHKCHSKRCATNADCRLADPRLADRRPADLQTCRLDKLAHSEICRPKFLWRQRVLWVPFFMPSRSQVLLRSPAKMDEGEQISTLWIT